MHEKIEGILEKIEKFYPEPHNYIYTKRFVVYIKIIEWEKMTGSNAMLPKVQEVLSLLDSEYSTTAKKKTFSTENINTLLKVECSIFYDSILISMPKDLGEKIFKIKIDTICNKFHLAGVLYSLLPTTIGYCYHKGNRVFGPAINDVLKQEKFSQQPSDSLYKRFWGILKSVKKFFSAQRIVAYIDIIGWVNATSSNGISTEVQNALSIVDKVYKQMNIDFESWKKSIGKINPLVQEIECGIFSDSILISMPENFKKSIFGIADICRKLLAEGFLCRGAIIKGVCYHKENYAFGPAINEVIAKEKEASYPRILCSEEIVKISHSYNSNFPYITTDCDNKKVLNLFQPFIAPTNQESLELLEQGLKIEEISKRIQDNIEKFKKLPDKESKKRLEKWQYAKSLMASQLNESIYKKYNAASFSVAFNN